MEDSIDFLIKIQSAWIYLEPIFGSEDIRNQMPVEGKMFEEVDSIWYHFFLNYLFVLFKLNIFLKNI
jgi:dynein heavy chain, axonemal